MDIKEAAESLQNHLTKVPEDEGVFCVYPSGNELLVNVNFIYRVPEVEAIKEWESFPVRIHRRSCW